jgi:hypothetical protein
MRRKIGAGRAGIGADDGVRTQQLVQRADDALRPDRPFRGGRERLELGVLGRPGGLRPRRAVMAALAAALCNLRDDHLQREARVAGDRDLCRIIGAQHRRVAIDMDDPRARRRMSPAFGGYRAGTAADEEDQIGVLDDRPGRCDAAIGAHDADCARVRFGDRSLSGDGCRDR